VRVAHRTLVRGVAAFVALVLCNRAGAQDTARAVLSEPDTARRPIRCVGQRVSGIVIHAYAPSVAALRDVPVLADIVRSIHTTTRPDLIRRYLLMSRGDVCTELRRAESERILRAQPFIADASVQAFPADSGSVELEVRTTDETSTIVGATVTSASPYLTSARLGSSNLEGDGVYLAGNWRHDPRFRDGYGLRYTDYQLGAMPYILNMEAQQDPLGEHWEIESAYPFLTDLQRHAWSVRTGSSNDYVFFAPDRDESHALSVKRQYFDLGGIVRIGPPGRLGLIGASLTGSHEVPGTGPILITPAGVLSDTTTAFVDRYGAEKVVRANALVGFRDIGFVRVRGFDALDATQDIPVGFQVGTQFGQSLTAFGAHDRDQFISGDAYVGMASQTEALRVQLQGEARHSLDRRQWEAVVSSGRAAHYLKVDENDMSIASVEWSGGWRMRQPFALTLSDQRGGVRGYATETAPGGQRLVARFEDRHFLGSPYHLGDVGTAFFVDAGRLWAANVPFGESTPVRFSLGFSLLANAPTRSPRLWRLDVALPVNPGGPRRLEFRIESSNRTSFFWREPRDIQLGREKTVPSSIFNWP
jgi:hypothetical protein